MADNKTQIIITAKDETRAAIASAQRGLQSLQAAGASVGSTLAGIGVSGGIVGLLGGAGAVAVLKGAIDDLDALNLSAERLGVSASKLEALNFAGKLAGLADDDIEKALTKISVKLEEAASGSKEAIAWFTKLGVAWLDASGKVKTADAAFAEISERISAMEDGTGKVTTLVEGFGEKLGRKLAPALNSGAKGLEALRREAEALGGGSYNLDELARQADTFNDNLDKIAFASRAAGRGLANEFLPSLNDTTEAMVKLISQGHTLQAVLRGIAGVGKLPFDALLGGVTKDLKDLSVDNQVKGLEQKLGGLQTKLKDASQPGGLLGRLVYGNPDEIRREIEVTQNQIASLVKFKDKLETKPEAKEPPKTTGGATPKGDKPKTSGGRAEADDAARLIAQLNEQIALKELDAASTDKMTAAEQQRAKVLYQLDSGVLKASASQRDKITSALDELVVLDRAIQAQREYTAAVERQESANLKARDSLREQIDAARESADIYGLTAAQIATVTLARLEDARALAEANGAYPEQLAFLDDEIAKRKELSDALDDLELKRLTSGTKSAEAKKREADIARLDRAKSAGKITDTEYEESMAKLKESVDELDEFGKQAAQSMQTAFADFFFNPARKGFRQMADDFAQAVAKMVANAGSAQLLRLLLGNDFSKTGELGGLVGSLWKGSSGSSGGIASWFGGLFSGSGGGAGAGGGIDWGSYVVPSWHSGGMVTPGGQTSMRSVSPLLFANAERFHSGGWPGIRNDEVPAILQKGELVLTQQQQRAYARGAGSPNITVHVNSPAGDPAEIRRSASAGARSALSLMSGAGRYR